MKVCDMLTDNIKEVKKNNVKQELKQKERKHVAKSNIVLNLNEW